MYLPNSIKIYSSTDTLSWKEFLPGIGPLKIEKTNRYILLKFSDLIPARRLRIVVEHYGIIPEGVPGGGNPAWLFVDEVEVF